MAASPLPAPGTKYGPCDAQAKCGHLDCQATVREANSRCHYCSGLCGYDVPLYQERSGWPKCWPTLTDTSGSAYVLVHAACLETSIEGKRFAPVIGTARA